MFYEKHKYIVKIVSKHAIKCLLSNFGGYKDKH